ncbi:hypothetical protein HS1genome_0354 [Sulfodiicoccus acidiphilus]|uniref:Dihydroorotate dehydrogenase electron transfer subunit iron-sulphur cluster binding domain-containing protein n=1 Tax=Sulfodiicoccus acidiphilus TaxID=1670455 RepID=A0A348B1B3_9CREN|nr:hypothetical protein HS1genome_0354 [Sulfodiicoccus acidiphilus]
MLEVKEAGKVTRITVRYPFRPEPGNFVSLVNPGQWEFPLAVGDYWMGRMELYVSSKRLSQWMKGREAVLLKGPLGTRLPAMREVLAFSTSVHLYDLLYPLREVVRGGGKARLVCEDCDTEFVDEVDRPEGVLVSVPPDKLMRMEVPFPAYVYVRWANMNCMLGVCGTCVVGGRLACTSGPFLKVESVESLREMLP